MQAYSQVVGGEKVYLFPLTGKMVVVSASGHPELYGRIERACAEANNQLPRDTENVVLAQFFSVLEEVRAFHLGG